jgi:hypothetical protein
VSYSARFDDTRHDNLVALINKHLGPFGLFPKSLARKDAQDNIGIQFTYGDMRQAGKRIILFYDDAPTAKRYDILWSSPEYLVSDWANVDNFPEMLRYETKSVQMHTRDPNRVYKLQWVLTASAELIVDSLWDPWDKVPNLHALSRQANGKNFDSFLNQMINYRINLLMTDFQNEVNSLDWARVLNKLNCNDNRAYRQYSCEAWKLSGLCENNETARSLCPLTCNACNWTRIVGKPGDKCSDHKQCMFGKCNLQLGICLNDDPNLPGERCGVDSQCWSGQCTNFICTGSVASLLHNGWEEQQDRAP